jgi:hypothetical protein
MKMPARTQDDWTIIAAVNTVHEIDCDPHHRDLRDSVCSCHAPSTSINDAHNARLSACANRSEGTKLMSWRMQILLWALYGRQNNVNVEREREQQ